MEYDQEDYVKLATWAMNILIHHQLTSASFIGVAQGYADAVAQKGKDNPVHDAEVAQLALLSVVIERRKEEVLFFTKKLEELKIPMPAVDYGKVGDMIDRVIKEGVIHVTKTDSNGIKKSMDKVFNGLDKVDIDGSD